jgi:hypothetical protein
MAGPLLDNIYQPTYDEQLRSLLKESKVFGIALFGSGTTIQKVPMTIFLRSSQNNPFALLDIADCTSEMTKGGKKDAKYIEVEGIDNVSINNTSSVHWHHC